MNGQVCVKNCNTAGFFKLNSFTVECFRLLVESMFRPSEGVLRAKWGGVQLNIRKVYLMFYLKNKGEPHTLRAQMQKCNVQRFDRHAVFIRVLNVFYMQGVCVYIYIFF